MEAYSKNPARIVSELEYQCGFEPGTLAGKKRSKYISKIRREAVLRMREVGLSFEDIARVLNRNHTTVMRIMEGGKAGDNVGTRRAKRVSKRLAKRRGGK